MYLITLDTMEEGGGDREGVSERERGSERERWGGGRETERERETLLLSRFAGGCAVPWLMDDCTEGAALLLNQ